MEKSSLSIVTLSLLIHTLSHSSSALDLSGALEGSCFDVNTTSLDLEWVTSVKAWHYPVMSRSDLYHTAMALLKKPAEEIPENYLYYMGCMTWGTDLNEKTAWMSGFGKDKIHYNIDFSQTLDRVEFYMKDTEKLVATCYTTLTDNKTFYVNVCCLNGMQMAWGVNSVMKYLPEESVKMIMDHAEAMGFDKKQFTGLSYDHC